MLTKRYYTQKEVADLVGVNPGIISYWEEKLRIFRPKKRGGRKLFTSSDLKKALLVKKLLDSGISLKGVKKRLEEESVEELMPEVLSEVVQEIKETIDQTLSELEELRRYLDEKLSNWRNPGNH
jgi:DNA-binding transcriptional MerR regulator